MPFQPGKSGNPGGRKGEKLFRDALRLASSREGPDGRKKFQEIADSIVEAAISHVEPSVMIHARNVVLDRLDGPVKLAVDVEDTGGMATAVIEAMAAAVLSARAMEARIINNQEPVLLLARETPE